MADAADPQIEPQAGADRPYLLVRSGALAGTRFDLRADEVVIGRNPGSAIALPDEGLSREHAVILRDARTGAFGIEDLQSSNGTKVNGKRIRSAELCHEDEIQLGQTRLRFLEAGLPVAPRHGGHGDDEDTMAFTSPPVTVDP